MDEIYLAGDIHYCPGVDELSVDQRKVYDEIQSILLKHKIRHVNLYMFRPWEKLKKDT